MSHPSTEPPSEQPANAPERAAEPAPGVFVPMLLGWLVPGAGHLWLRRRWPAVFIAGAILPLYAVGMALTGWENVSPERHPWYFALHALVALPTAAATLLTRAVVIDRPYPLSGVGELYTAVAGLLNLVAVADCWARSRHGDPDPAEDAPRAPLAPEDLVDAPPADGSAADA
jgi:hypothetical protein